MSELDCWSLKDNNTKRWDVILNGITVRSTKRIDDVISNGVIDIKLYHGLTLISSIKLLGEYLSVCYCRSTQEYLVLDDCSMIYRYSIQGKYILPPFPLIARILNNNIPNEEDEEPIMKYDKYEKHEKEEDKMNILHPVSSVPLGSLDPTINTQCLE
ncbi:hypothetical protein PV327_008509 [Microctonus hyperodae]|uniref:Uncharacterized protein n=1 Tax=Microctonus hyperodae TaxID=165561 RepID=A0AA39KHL9_MICHY|nr:hypothetical protein PV327_008509 [Microctonus hyperodae]